MIASAGASSALGGPDLVGDLPLAGAVLEALNITDRTPDQADGHIQGEGAGSQSPRASPPEDKQLPPRACHGIKQSQANETGLENASPNASLGARNSRIIDEDCKLSPPGQEEAPGPDGVDGTDMPPANANPNVPQRADNANEGIDNASDNATTGREHANPNALQGQGNAQNDNNPEPGGQPSPVIPNDNRQEPPFP